MRWRRREPTPEFAPEGGFELAAYPQLTADWVPYTTDPNVREDPLISIQSTGWMFIQVGNIRLAIPDEEEWMKLVAMGTKLWNTHKAQSEDS